MKKKAVKKAAKKTTGIIPIPAADYLPRQLVSVTDMHPPGTVKVLMPRSKKELAAFAYRQKEEAYQRGCSDVLKRQATNTAAGGQVMRQESICQMVRAGADIAIANSKLTYAMSRLMDQIK